MTLVVHHQQRVTPQQQNEQITDFQGWLEKNMYWGPRVSFGSDKSILMETVEKTNNVVNA